MPTESRGPTGISTTLAFCLISILLIGGLLAYIIQSQYRQLEKQAHTDTMTIAGFLAADMQRTLYGVSQVLNGIHLVLDVAPSPVRDQSPEIRAVLEEYKRLNPFLMDLLVLDKSGKITHWTGPGTPPDVRDRDYAAFHMDAADSGLYVGQPQLSRVRTGRWFFGVSQAFRHAGNMSNIVVAIVDLNYLKQQFRKMEIGAGTTLVIASFEGRVYTRVPDHDRFVGSNLQQAASIAASGRIRQSFRTTSPFDPVPRFVSTTPVEGYPIMAGASFDERLIFRNWQSNAILLLLLVVLITAALLTGCTIIVRHQQMQIRLRSELAQQAVTDALTGLFNRRYMMDSAKREIAQAQRSGRPLSLIMLDIDFFKSVNDRFGHDSGDQVLRTVARRIASLCRVSDTLCRYGGEEFVMLLPDTDPEGAVSLAEKIRLEIAALQVEVGGSCISLTLSQGISTLQDEESHIETVLNRADQALYQAKSDGRNCVRSLTG